MTILTIRDGNHTVRITYADEREACAIYFEDTVSHTSFIWRYASPKATREAFARLTERLG